MFGLNGYQAKLLRKLKQHFKNQNYRTRFNDGFDLAKHTTEFKMSFLNQIPTMERDSLRDLKKGIDLSFKDFSRAYGDAIEGFFDPLLSFLIWLEKLLVITPDLDLESK